MFRISTVKVVVSSGEATGICAVASVTNSAGLHSHSSPSAAASGVPKPRQIVSVGYTCSPGGPGTTDTVTSVVPVQPMSSVSSTEYVVVSVGDATTAVALALSKPTAGVQMALAAPSATSGAPSPKQMAVFSGTTAAATLCTTTLMEAVASPQLFESVTLNTDVPGGGVRF